jgi:hypothetical protein
MDPEGSWALWGILQWCVFCNMMPWYLSTRIHGNTSQKTVILLVTLFTRAHHFLMLYCTVIIFLTRKMCFCQTLYLIWQLAVSAAVFMPWLPIMSAALFTSCQYGHWCQLHTLFFTPWWSPVSTAHPSSYAKAISSVHYRSFTCDGSYWQLLSDIWICFYSSALHYLRKCAHYGLWIMEHFSASMITHKSARTCLTFWTGTNNIKSHGGGKHVKVAAQIHLAVCITVSCSHVWKLISTLNVIINNNTSAHEIHMWYIFLKITTGTSSLLP